MPEVILPPASTTTDNQTSMLQSGVQVSMSKIASFFGKRPHVRDALLSHRVRCRAPESPSPLPLWPCRSPSSSRCPHGRRRAPESPSRPPLWPCRSPSFQSLSSWPSPCSRVAVATPLVAVFVAELQSPSPSAATPHPTPANGPATLVGGKAVTSGSHSRTSITQKPLAPLRMNESRLPDDLPRRVELIGRARQKAWSLVLEQSEQVVSLRERAVIAVVFLQEIRPILRQEMPRDSGPQRRSPGADEVNIARVRYDDPGDQRMVLGAVSPG